MNALLNPKSTAELAVLEKQVERKLDSDEPIDVEYWEQLLHNITVYKARAELKQLSQAIKSKQSQLYQQEQQREAISFQSRLVTSLSTTGDASSIEKARNSSLTALTSNPELSDPDAALKIRSEDGGFEIIAEGSFLDEVVRIGLANANLCY